MVALSILGWLGFLTAFGAFLVTYGRNRRLLAKILWMTPIAEVVQTTQQAVIIADADRRILWVNDAFSRITEYSFSEVQGKNPGSILQCAETSAATIAKMRAAFNSCQSFQGELLNCTKSGRQYWVQIDIEPRFDSDHKLVGFTSIQRDITDRVKLETALEESRTLFNGALNASTDSLAILDAHGNVLFVNDKWRVANRPSDTHPANSVGSNYFEQLSAANYKIIMDGIASILDGQSECLELEYEEPSANDPKWSLLRITKFHSQGPTRLVVSLQDISARRANLQRLQNKQEKLRAVYEACSDGILLFNSAGLFECNRSALSMLGAKEFEELLNKQLCEFTFSDQSPRHLFESEIRDYIDVAITHGTARFETEMVRLDGSVFPAELLLTTFRCDDEQVLHVAIRDNTQRMAVELRLKQMNERLQEDLNERIATEVKMRETTAYLDVYRKIVDHHAIVAETDTKGTIVAVNDAFCKISGYSREELIGQNHRILRSGRHPKSMWTEMYKTVANGGCWHGEICNRAKNGQLYWVDTTIAPLFNEAGKLRGYFAIRADITLLKKSQVQAEAASKSKSEFLANMSHEIRTPMTAILGYTDILMEIEGCSHCESSQQTYVAVETIKRNGEHLLDIINDILDISKIEADKLTIESVPVDLPRLISDVMRTMQVKAQGKGLVLACTIASPVPTQITTDPTRLRQILVNLIGNAIKFTEYGSVSLLLRMHPTNQRMLAIDVVDTGIGMTSEQVGRLFQAFEQADTSTTRRFGGTGLGLRISKRLAEMLGGDIAVDSHFGKGCTFTVTFDAGEFESTCLRQGCDFFAEVADESAPELCLVGTQNASVPSPTENAVNAPFSAAASLTAQPLVGIRVLLAEDGPDNQRLIMHHLRKAGATVSLVQNGRLAVEAMTVDGNIESPLMDVYPVDMILMDMQMPLMDGYEATKLLRSKGAKLPILALTAHAMSGDLERCLDAGCNLRLTKPISRTALIEACRALYGWRQEETYPTSTEPDELQLQQM